MSEDSSFQAAFVSLKSTSVKSSCKRSYRYLSSWKRVTHSKNIGRYGVYRGRLRTEFHAPCTGQFSAGAALRIAHSCPRCIEDRGCLTHTYRRSAQASEWHTCCRAPPLSISKAPLQWIRRRRSGGRTLSKGQSRPCRRNTIGKIGGSVARAITPGVSVVAGRQIVF